MLNRRSLATAVVCAAAATGLSTVPIASAVGAGRTRAIHSELTVLGEAKPDCHGGVCLIHNHGSGTLSGFGRVSFTTAITDDGRASPCAKGSYVPQLHRVIRTDEGTLALNEAGLVCAQPGIGPRVDLVWVVDGAASTGTFAHATGSGTDHAVLGRNTDSQTGSITLAG